MSILCFLFHGIAHNATPRLTFAVSCTLFSDGFAGHHSPICALLSVYPPKIINFNRVFHYKPSILGAHPALFSRQVATVSINQFAPALALLTSLLGCRWRHDDVGPWLTVETHRNAATGGGHGSLVSAFPVVNIAEHQNLPENHGGRGMQTHHQWTDGFIFDRCVS